MRLWIRFISVAVGAMLCSSSLMYADTAAELLEKGIYNEETVGNLDEAIKIYRKVVDAASETERLAAKAQFRLAQCLLKQQKKDEAIKAFEVLVAKYPEQKELIARAKQYLPDKLQLSKAPWQDGERLTLTMKLPGGQTIGIVGLGVDSATSNGKEIWEMAIRRFVAAGQNEGVSLVTVDKSTNRPMRSTWAHTVLGDTDAVWYDDKVVIASKKDGEAEQKTIELDQLTFSNDQLFYGFRQLPLAVGYKVTIPIRVAFAGGNAIDLKVEVEKKETVKTPVGEFDCFRLDTNILQTFWIADVPERYLVKFTAEGVSAELTSIGSAATSTQLENEKLGYSLTVPSGWFYHELQTSNDDNASGYRLVAPLMASAVVSVKDDALLDSDDRGSVEVWAESKIKRGKRTFKDYELRPGSMTDARLAEADGKTYVVDHELQGTVYTREVTLALARSKAIAVAGTAKKSDYDAYREEFDILRQSISLR